MSFQNLSNHNSNQNSNKNSNNWNSEKVQYQNKIKDLEKEINSLKNQNCDLIKILKTNTVATATTGIKHTDISTLKSNLKENINNIINNSINNKINNKTDSSSSGQTNNNNISHSNSNFKSNVFIHSTYNSINSINNINKGININNNETNSKKSSDEGELLSSFKKRINISRKTKSYGAINIQDLISSNCFSNSNTISKLNTQLPKSNKNNNKLSNNINFNNGSTSNNINFNSSNTNLRFNKYNTFNSWKENKNNKPSSFGNINIIDPITKKALPKSSNYDDNNNSINNCNIHFINKAQLYKNIKNKNYNNPQKKLFLSNIEEVFAIPNNVDKNANSNNSNKNNSKSNKKTTINNNNPKNKMSNTALLVSSLLGSNNYNAFNNKKSQNNNSTMKKESGLTTNLNINANTSSNKLLKTNTVANTNTSTNIATNNNNNKKCFNNTIANFKMNNNKNTHKSEASKLSFSNQELVFINNNEKETSNKLSSKSKLLQISNMNSSKQSATPKPSTFNTINNNFSYNILCESNKSSNKIKSKIKVNKKTDNYSNNKEKTITSNVSNSINKNTNNTININTPLNINNRNNINSKIKNSNNNSTTLKISLKDIKTKELKSIYAQLKSLIINNNIKNNSNSDEIKAIIEKSFLLYKSKFDLLYHRGSLFITAVTTKNTEILKLILDYYKNFFLFDKHTNSDYLRNLNNLKEIIEIIIEEEENITEEIRNILNEYVDLDSSVSDHNNVGNEENLDIENEGCGESFTNKNYCIAGLNDDNLNTDEENENYNRDTVSCHFGIRVDNKNKDDKNTNELHEIQDNSRNNVNMRYLTINYNNNIINNDNISHSTNKSNKLKENSNSNNTNNNISTNSEITTINMHNNTNNQLLEDSFNMMNSSININVSSKLNNNNSLNISGISQKENTLCSNNNFISNSYNNIRNNDNSRNIIENNTNNNITNNTNNNITYNTSKSNNTGNTVINKTKNINNSNNNNSGKANINSNLETSTLSNKTQETTINNTSINKKTNNNNNINNNKTNTTIVNTNTPYYNNLQPKNPKKIISLHNDSISINSLRDSIKSLSVVPSNSSNSPKSVPSLLLKYHLDSVRVVETIKNNSILVSAGDDGIINLWHLKKDYKEVKEPMLGLRSHKTGIYTLEGISDANSNCNIIKINGYSEFFSSGSNGDIKHWSIPDKIFSFNRYCSYENSMNCEIDSWKNSNEMIWSIKYLNNKLAVGSSDGYVRIWKVGSENRIADSKSK